MLRVVQKFERFLKLDEITSKSKLMRARAVYLIGMAFILTQTVNQVMMYHSYGGLTFDHLVSTLACIFVFSTVLYLRQNKSFPIYAGIYSVLIVAATMASAMNQNTGINSALIPFFILGIVANGFICGWRATVMFAAISVACIWSLWWVSSQYSYTPIFDVDRFADRNFQRAVQASLAIFMLTIISGFFSKNMHEAFGELEAGIFSAQESDRAKTEFLATMSHELYTPMNGIIGINDILEETDLDEDQRELTDMIRASGRDLQTIIGNVLLFSQLDAGRVSIDAEEFDLRRCIASALRPYAPMAHSKGLQLSVDVCDSVPSHLIGDGPRTAQILGALLDNAIKFTSRGLISLSVRGAADAHGRAQIIMAVGDTGIGIANEDLTRIFERFTQVDGSIKRSHGGTGLGLTVARGLVGLMSGDIVAQSSAGEGSVFTARFDFAIAQSDAANVKLAAE